MPAISAANTCRQDWRPDFRDSWCLTPHALGLGIGEQSPGQLLEMAELGQSSCWVMAYAASSNVISHLDIAQITTLYEGQQTRLHEATTSVDIESWMDPPG